MWCRMEFSHIREDQQPRMVDITAKSVSKRTASAEAVVWLGPEVLALLRDGDIRGAKGPVFQTAIVAGTQAAKRTAEWIPFCHTLPLEACDIRVAACGDGERVRIRCSAATMHKTGVEMEALTGASAAALCVYDMCKAVSQAIVIESVRLLEKSGGKSNYSAEKP